MTKSVSLVVIDDNRLVREAIAFLIQQQPGFEVLECSARIDDAVRNVREAKPGIVLLDSTLRDHDSLRLTARIHREVPDARIVVMGLLPHSGDIAAFVKAGAQGFIVKHAPFNEFIATIRSVARGDNALPREFTAALFDEIAREAMRMPRTRDIRALRLTPRERQVVALVGQGLSNKQIAARLHIAPHTAKSHVHNILEKLELRTRVDIASMAALEANRTQEPGS